MPLPSPQDAAAVLEMYYLEARCHLLETAAIFDRLDRARGAAEMKNDSRYQKLRVALKILQEDDGGRVEKFLNAFSEDAAPPAPAPAPTITYQMRRRKFKKSFLGNNASQEDSQ